MLGYLQGSTIPDISMAVHQCTRFNAYPMLCHEKAVKWIVCYLLSSSDKGIVYKPDLMHGLKYMLMLTSLVVGLQGMSIILSVFFHKQDMSSCTLAILSTGPANFTWK